MSRLEPNLLLAVATGFALILLVMTSALAGGDGAWVRLTILAVVCAAGFVIGNRLLMKRMGRVSPPMINPAAPSSAVWAMIAPILVLLGAALPVFRPGYDYGLLVIIGAVWFGLTVESAMKAREG